MLNKIALFILIFLSVFASNVFADKTILWQRAPIEVRLPVGKERFITFPSVVEFGYNPQLLPASVLSVENDNQSIYLLAKKVFPAQRVEAKLPNGEIILLDIQGVAKGSHTPIDILLPEVHVLTPANTVSRANSNYVALMRYAIQQLYAPTSLLKNATGISRFPMQTSHVVPLSYDGSFTAMPLASWQSNNTYVTALMIKNNLHSSLQLEPKFLCGNWQAASFYPNTVIAGEGAPLSQDSTTLFLVSIAPFAQAIQDCMNS